MTEEIKKIQVDQEEMDELLSLPNRLEEQWVHFFSEILKKVTDAYPGFINSDSLSTIALICRNSIEDVHNYSQKCRESIFKQWKIK